MHAKIVKTIGICLASICASVVMATAALDNGIVKSPHIIHRHSGLRGHHHAPVMRVDARQVAHPGQPPNGPVFRCHDPHPEQFGPAPSVEDCKDVIRQFAALTEVIDVKLVEGCKQITSGNCTGSVCPQRVGESSIPGSVAAQYMESPILDQCIAKGQRGWWNDGQGLGNKDGCYSYIHMQRPRDADLFDDFCKDKLPHDHIYVPPQHQPPNPEDEDDLVPDQHAAFGIQKATQPSREPAWKDLNLASLMNKGPAVPGRRLGGTGLPR
ncbi:Apc13p protein-domain-containing protein [Xylariaceae sp. FL0594]|nr:Apc13p protein-domain-containing protein [Xylariaceae sp. FL0594]